MKHRCDIAGTYCRGAAGWPGIALRAVNAAKKILFFSTLGSIRTCGARIADL
jgi:hypothetical protein